MNIQIQWEFEKLSDFILSIIHNLNLKCLRSERPMFSGLAALPSSLPSYACSKSSWLPNNLEDRSSSLVNEIALQILSLSSSYLLRYLIKDKWSPSRYCSNCYLSCVGSTHSPHCHAVTLHVCPSFFPLKRWDLWRQEPNSIFISLLLDTRVHTKYLLNALK